MFLRLHKMQGDTVLRLIVRNLTKSISGEIILNKASYSFDTGKIYGVSAKDALRLAVLLRCISGEEGFDRGYIRIREGALERKPGYNDVCLVYENSPFIEMMTGREFVKYYMDIHNCHDKSIEECLDLIGLPPNYRGRLIQEYPKAALRRLQILCIYMAGPDVILIEEPFEMEEGCEFAIFEKLVNELKNNHIIIISSTDFDKIKRISDEVLLLNDGVLCGIDMRNNEDINEINVLTVDLEDNND